MEKYTVLTYIINNYEIVHEIKEKSENAEYLLITDDPNLTSETWTVIYDSTLTGSTFDKCYQIRFNPFKYANTNICIRIDGSMRPDSNLDPIVKKFINGGYDMSLMVHPTRQTMIKEYQAWVGFREYPIEQAQKCLNFMQNVEHYNINEYKGMYQMNYEISRNAKISNNWHLMCYSTLKYLGTEPDTIERVDQTITSFLLNKYFSDANVMWVDERIVHSKYFSWYAHGTNQQLGFDFSKLEKPFGFNKRVQTIRPEDF